MKVKKKIRFSQTITPSDVEYFQIYIPPSSGKLRPIFGWDALMMVFIMVLSGPCDKWLMLLNGSCDKRKVGCTNFLR